MTRTGDLHNPTPEFRADLEREISRALRRETRMQHDRRLVRRVPAIWLGGLAAALAIGIFVGAAPAQVQEAREREALIQAAQAEERLAALRLEIAREQANRAQEMMARGVLASAAVASAQGDLRIAQLELARIRLNMEEIRATARPPRDDPGAPLVGRRDFVRERLQLEVAAADQAVAQARDAMQLAERRAQIGAATQQELHEAQAEMRRLEEHMARLANRVALREQVLREELSPAEAESRSQLLDVQLRLLRARSMYDAAKLQLELARRQHEAGVISRAELLRAELEVLEHDAQIARLQRELALLDLRRGSTPPPQ